MSNPEFRRLERIEVDRLFNVYDHRIDLKLDDRVTLLHGPNGSHAKYQISKRRRLI